MEVEVLVGQVGVGGDVEGDSGDPVLGDAVGGGLQHRGGHPGVDQPAHPGLDHGRVEGGHGRSG